jgi:hypothetical protein
MAKRMSRLTIDKCEKCALIGGDMKVGEDLCTAFEFPEWQWRNGECWGRGDAEELVRRLQAIISYNECHGMNTAGVAKMKKELKDWQETVRVWYLVKQGIPG